MHNWIHNRRGRWRAFLSLTAATAIMASPATAMATPSPSPSPTPTASVPAATPATQPGTPPSTTAAGTADRAGSDKIAAVPTDAPLSFSQLTEPPEREGTPHHEGEAILRAQQDALTVPVDALPAAPAAPAARIQSDPLPDGFTEEDARLSLRMQTALAADCQVYFPSPFAVCGEIRNKYNAMGGPSSFLGLPKTEELQNPGATGFRSEFLHGSIYWSPTTGAHPVTPLFMTKWNEHGWEAGWMGYPTSDEIGHPGAEGSHQEFEGAAIYWHATTLTLAAIGGAIRDKWDALGAQDSMLGYPTSDENDTPDGIGKYNTFEYGSIYWSPATGADEVYGVLLAIWEQYGAEASNFGYPTGAQYFNIDQELEQQFENGTLNASSEIFDEGTELFNGKQISSWVMDQLRQMASEEGFDLDSAFTPMPSGQNPVQPQVAPGSAPFPDNPDTGGIEIPDDYLYTGVTGDTLHDFCTHSPDEFPSPGANANFRGPCAIHDMCYESTDGNDKNGMRTCDSNLRNNLMKVCEGVYTGISDNVRRQPYRATALGYYSAVVAAHHDNYF